MKSKEEIAIENLHADNQDLREDNHALLKENNELHDKLDMLVLELGELKVKIAQEDKYAFGKLKEILNNYKREQLLNEACNEMLDALVFYGNPDTYFAIAFLGDPPCGSFIKDTSYCPSVTSYKPGKLARETVQKINAKLSVEKIG